MLKLATIYGIIMTTLGIGFNLKNSLVSNKFSDRIGNFLAIILNIPILYVFIKMLQMFQYYMYL